MNGRVTIEVVDGVADVRLNRADKMNALDGAMLDGLVAAGAQLRETPGLRAVVLSGEGRSFCAGLDVSNFTQGLAADLDSRTHGRSNIYQHVAMLWRELPVPVIAAITGVCFGGGVQIALGADIRIAAPDARFSIMEIKWGLVPDMGGFVLTRGLVRDDVVRELVYSGRIVEAPEAVAIGLCTRLSENPHADAMAAARAIAGRNPDAIRAAKTLFEATDNGDTALLLNAESKAQTAIMASPNQAEAVMAEMQKRAPRFVD